jgi:hypothetical protein
MQISAAYPEVSPLPSRCPLSDGSPPTAGVRDYVESRNSTTYVTGQVRAPSFPSQIQLRSFHQGLASLRLP